MNELHFAYKLRQHLNRSLHELPSGTTDRLAAARQRALSHQKQAVSQPVLATAGNFVLMHAMGANAAGQVASAMAGGVLLALMAGA